MQRKRQIYRTAAMTSLRLKIFQVKWFVKRFTIPAIKGTKQFLDWTVQVPRAFNVAKLANFVSAHVEFFFPVTEISVTGVARLLHKNTLKY